MPHKFILQHAINCRSLVTLAVLLLPGCYTLQAADTALSINLGPTTITFTSSVTYVTHPNGGISVDLASNPVLSSISTATVDRGGAMWEPFAGHTGYSGAGDQGWDALIRKKDNVLCYDHALNVAPEANNNMAFTIPGEGSLVIGIPNPTPGNTWNEQISEEPNEQYRVVNFVNTLPADGSYRAPVRGPTEIRPNWHQATVRSNLDLYFPHDMDLSGLESQEMALNVLGFAKAMASAGISWTGYPTESRQPKLGWNVYGYNWTVTYGRCLMHLRNTQLTAQQREELADAIVQIGIDHYGIVRDGSYWQMNGGWTHGRIWAVDIAGLLLGDDYIRNVANDPLGSEMAPGEILTVYPFTEQRQYIPITAMPRTTGTNPSVSDQVSPWGSSLDRNTKANEKMPPGPEEVGLPIWMVANDRGWSSDVISMEIGRTGYHSVNTRSQVYPRLAYEWLLNVEGNGADFSGTEYIRNGIDLSLQDWEDYKARKSEIVAQGVLGSFNFMDSGANPYYQELDPALRFKTRPSRAYPPLVHMDGVSATVEFCAMEPSHGYAITRRDMRWRINEGPWTELLDASDNTQIFHGGSAGDTFEAQVRLHNQEGYGSWSYSYINTKNGNIFGTAVVADTGNEEASLNEFSRDRAIFDTGAQLGLASANVPLSGAATLEDGITPVPDGMVIEARAYSVDDAGASSTAWTEVGTSSGGLWAGTIDAPRNISWYRAEARVKNSSAPPAQMVNRFGAGHVWAIYEQSNWARLLQNNSALPPNDPVPHPGDVFIFRRNGVLDEVLDDGADSPSLAALANALSAERPGEKFAIAFHTVSGTAPGDMLTTAAEDATYGTGGDRDWEDDLALHNWITADGSPVGLVTINGWIAFGNGKPSLANTFTKYFLGKDIDGTPTTPEAEGVPRFLTEIYDWSYSRLAWVGPHGRDNGSVSGDTVSSLADLPGYGKDTDEDYAELVDRLRTNFGQLHLPETLPIVMETVGGQRGVPNGSSGWKDYAHYNGNSKDGREMLARLGMAATLKTLGLVDWPIPKFDSRYDEPTGAYVEFWMEGYDITTLRRLRGADGTLGEYPAEIPDTFPHRTEVMGWEIDGRPAERAEIVPDAGGSGFYGVRVYPNTGRPNFSHFSKVIYGPGTFVGRQIKVEDPKDGIHLNYAVVDVGQADLPALPVQPRSTADLACTLPPAPGITPSLVVEGQTSLGANGHIWDNDQGGPGDAMGSFTVEILVTLPNFTSDLILWESGSNATGTCFLIHDNQFALTLGDSADNYVTGIIPSALQDTEIRFVARFDTVNDKVEVWLNDTPVDTPNAADTFIDIDEWAASNDGDAIGYWNDNPSVRSTNAPGFVVDSGNPWNSHDKLSEYTTYDGSSGGDRILFKYWNRALSDAELVTTTAISEASGGPDIFPPSTPSDFGASNITESSIALSWTASVDNVGVVGYHIYVDSILTETVATASNTLYNLQPQTAYSIEVSAFDAVGNESLLSDPIVVATAPVPATPGSYSLTAAALSDAASNPHTPDTGDTSITVGQLTISSTGTGGGNIGWADVHATNGNPETFGIMGYHDAEIGSIDPDAIEELTLSFSSPASITSMIMHGLSNNENEVYLVGFPSDPGVTASANFNITYDQPTQTLTIKRIGNFLASTTFTFSNSVPVTEIALSCPNAIYGSGGFGISEINYEIFDVLDSLHFIADLTTADGWFEVTSANSFTNPVYIATLEGPETVPAVVMIRDVDADSYEVCIKQPTPYFDPTITYDVHVLIVESGNHNGMWEAGRLNSTVTDSKAAGYVGEAVTFQNTYSTPPVVLGQIIVPANQDPDWSAFWTQPATVTSSYLGKHIGEDTVNPTRPNSDIGYIIIPADFPVNIDGRIAYANFTGQTIGAVGDNGPWSVAMELSGFSSIDSVFLSQQGMEGGDGSWPFIVAPSAINSTDITISLDEDQLSDDERKHTEENVGILVFEGP